MKIVKVTVTLKEDHVKAIDQIARERAALIELRLFSVPYEFISWLFGKQRKVMHCVHSRQDHGAGRALA